jgi:hypothetical protein
MKLKNDYFWIYVLHEDAHKKTSIKSRSFKNDWLSLDAEGNIIVKKNYAWDGCSPKGAFLDQIWGTPDGMIDLKTEKPKTYLASLFHDVLYQFGSQTGVTRSEADQLFLACMKEMDFFWAYPYYAAVRAFGWLFYDRAKT